MFYQTLHGNFMKSEPISNFLLLKASQIFNELHIFATSP